MLTSTMAACSSCQSAVSPGERFCRVCGAQIGDSTPPPTVGPAMPGAGSAPGSEAGLLPLRGELVQRLDRVWSMRMMRVPLIAVALTLAGVYLPWLSRGGQTIALSSATNGWLPILVAAVVATGLVLYATTPSRPEALLMAVCGVAFMIAVLAVVLTAVVGLGTNFVSSLAESFGDSATDGAGGNISLGFGAYITTAASITLLLSTQRLLRHHELSGA